MPEQAKLVKPLRGELAYFLLGTFEQTILPRP